MNACNTEKLNRKQIEGSNEKNKQTQRKIS